MTELANKQRSFEEQLNVMRQSYAARLPAKIDQIGECWRQWRTPLEETPAGPPSTGNVEIGNALFRMAHSLVGTGRTFGMPAVTEAARTLENLIESVTKARSAPTAAQDAQFEALLEVLRRAASTPEALLQPMQNYVPSELQNEFLTPPETSAWPQENNHLILLLGQGQQEARVEDEDGLSQNPSRSTGLIAQLQYFGYQVHVCEWRENYPARLFQQTLEQSMPAAVLVQGNIAQLKAAVAALQPFQAGRDGPLPLIFISERDDLETRLLAVRAGSDEFFTIPVDASSLSGKLQTLTARQSSTTFHALIVEDEAALSNLYAFILQQSGMMATVASDPYCVLSLLHETTPDLILMDIHLPGCNGLELARAIRQMDAFAGVPIIFLSSDTNYRRQMAAMHLGGDLFLSKPVQPERLAAAAIAAAQRSRVLRAFMVRDSLTGLFNHTHTKEQLDIELARSIRTRTPLSLALLDLDNFQQVNEKHNHTHGDRVLKSITRLLRQLVRKTDTVGRYDGDAFVVILPEAAAPDAEKVMERIRNHFEKVCHRTSQAEFCVTFSCGITTLQPSPENERHPQLTDHLFREATRALAQAKAAGRNRITLAGAVTP